MFNEIRNLIASSDIDEKTLTAASAYLLRKQFIYRSQPGDRRHYQLIDRHFTIFERGFAFFGAELVRNAESAYIGYIPKNQLSNLKLVETACLLTLRLIYDQEKLTGVSETKDGSVIVSGDRVIQEYRRNTGRDDLGKQIAFRDAIKPLRQKSVVRLGEKDPDTDVEDIIIMPSIEQIIDQYYAANLIKALENQHASTDDTENEDEEDLMHEAD